MSLRRSGQPRSRRPRLAVVALLVAAVTVAGTAVVAGGCTGRGVPRHGGAPVVVEVIDGDTLVVRFDGRDETVRLLGIDTPETVHPSRPVECFGPEAAARLAELLPAGTPVAAERDVEAVDPYGRLLLHLHRGDGTFVNRELVLGGFATTLSIAPNRAYASELAAAEHEARAQRRGLWGACGDHLGASDSVPV